MGAGAIPVLVNPRTGANWGIILAGKTMEFAMIPVNLDERTISVGQLVQAMGCLHSVLLDDATFREARRSRSAGRKRVTLLGLAAHAFAAGKATDEVKKVAQRGNARRDRRGTAGGAGQREAQRQRMQARREREGRFVQREQTVSVVERRTGWKIFAQPDRYEAPLDASGEYLQITTSNSRLKFATGTS